MLTGMKDQRVYTAQITPYCNEVVAEIVYTDLKDFQTGLYYTAIRKTFGSSFYKQPRENDWINAKKWVDEQLRLIEKYSTALVKSPVPFRTQMADNT